MHLSLKSAYESNCAATLGLFICTLSIILETEISPHPYSRCTTGTYDALKEEQHDGAEQS